MKAFLFAVLALLAFACTNPQAEPQALAASAADIPEAYDVSPDRVGDVPAGVGYVYRFEVSGEVLLAHPVEFADSNPDVAICGCAAVIPIPYAIQAAFVEIDVPNFTYLDILKRVKLHPRLARSHMVGEWITYKFKYLGRFKKNTIAEESI